jgi:glycosyltransferase involved in cell wall biosynthesis
LTIGLPVYNGEALLAAALASLLAQTFADFELIVCDNASTDATREIVEDVAARDPRVTYVRNERNIGANGNFSKVARLGSAPLFKWAAHDDLYAPTYLERCVEVLDRRPDVVLVHADTTFIDAAGAPFPTPEGGERAFIEPASRSRYAPDPLDLAEQSSALDRFRHVLFHSLWGTHMFGVIRRAALERTALIQNVPSSDRPLLVELALLGPFHTVRERLYLKRFHGRMTLGLTEAEIRRYLGADAEGLAQRRRQLAAFMAAPRGKPVSPFVAAACRSLVLAYAAKVATRTARGLGHQAIRPPGPAAPIGRPVPGTAKAPAARPGSPDPTAGMSS